MVRVHERRVVIKYDSFSETQPIEKGGIFRPFELRQFPKFVVSVEREAVFVFVGEAVF